MNIFKNLFVLFFFHLISSTFAQEIILVKSLKNNTLIGKHIEYLEDKSGALDLKDIINNKHFLKSSNSVLNFGTTQSTYWLKFSVKNFQQEKIFIEIQNPIIDYAHIYIVTNNQLKETYFINEDDSFSKRLITNKNILFPIASETDTVTKTIYLKIINSEHLSLPIILGTSDQLVDNENNYNLLFGIYIGIILVMFFYNLFLYMSIKDPSYLYYIAYILSVGIAQASLKGYLFEYIFPNLPIIASRSALIFSSLTGIFAILFLRYFLQVKKFTPTLNKILLSLILLYSLSLLFALIDFQRISCVLVDIGGLTASIFIIFTIIKIIKLGYKPAKYVLYSWSLFLISILIFLLKDFALLPFNIVTDNIIEIGSALEVTLLSFALADRINIFKKEKEDSQAQALDALLQNELMIRNQNIVLEKKVEERTKELKISNEELSDAIAELKQTQSQLVNSEKMASLGQLTAGIAHEINNPINFVVSNVKPLKRDIEDIYELVRKYEEINQKEIFDEKIIEVNNYKNEIDYTYIKEEIEHLLKGIEDGAIRTADIVRGLRVFSRLDENDLKRTNITEGINSTLTLLNSEITGASIDLVKNFSSIPEIECFPGKLNQVFMNILNNAIFAIKDNKERKEKGKLVISTANNDTSVFVTIRDNGTGMTEEVKAKIFEPFFTTKGVGKGTGLGMSITFSIINDHHGTIDMETKHGEGTEFIIALPINYTKQ